MALNEITQVPLVTQDELSQAYDAMIAAMVAHEDKADRLLVANRAEEDSMIELMERRRKWEAVVARQVQNVRDKRMEVPSGPRRDRFGWRPQ